MKNWQEIYNKYKDTELMKEFVDWWDNKGGEEFLWAWDGDKDRFGEENSILDIWGYLICFMGRNRHKRIVEGSNYSRTPEQAMLWCAEKFFEEKK